MKHYKPFYRITPIDEGQMSGEFIIAENIIEQTRNILTYYSGLGDHGHEGLVFWCGRQFDNLTIFTTVLSPETTSEPQRVMVDESSFGKSSKKTRGNKLSILAQVHSHPGKLSIHSEGDDHLIIMPFEGMLSIVVPFYGKEFYTLKNCTFHQFQNSKWIVCSPSSVKENLSVAPNLIDLRSDT